MLLDPFPNRDIPGLEAQRWASEFSALQIAYDKGQLPTHFPLALWAAQTQRYRYYWYWYRGDILKEEVGRDDKGRPVYRYPLGINPIRNFARKHTALLFGEMPDTPHQLIRSVVEPASALYGEDQTESEKREAVWLSGLLNRARDQNYARGTMLENGLLCQFLGGCVFQLTYEPNRSDLDVPIVMKNVYPDFFLPVWSNGNPYDLLEAYIVYRIPSAAAERQWGIKQSLGVNFMLYVEYWNKETMSIWIDGQPLKVSYRGVQVTYQDRPHPFGFIPIVYIPRLRDGNFYGSSFVPDVDGLAVEFNARLADEGDAVRKSVHRKRFARDIAGDVKIRTLDQLGNKYYDLGFSNFSNGNKPEIFSEDTPNWSAGFSGFKEFIWKQLTREAGLGSVNFGDDEGSQRSGLTLYLRMWPSTAYARPQRIYWTEGLNRLDYYYLSMMRALGLKHNRRVVPEDFHHRYALGQDWLPMLPRDREALVDEIIRRLQAHAISPEEALARFGDVPDVKEEYEKIREFIQFMSSVSKPLTESSANSTSTGSE